MPCGFCPEGFSTEVWYWSCRAVDWARWDMSIATHESSKGEVRCLRLAAWRIRREEHRCGRSKHMHMSKAIGLRYRPAPEP